MLDEAPCEVRPCGSVAFKMALVAAGQADGTWTLVPKSEWDVAAGTALVRAAGRVRNPRRRYGTRLQSARTTASESHGRQYGNPQRFSGKLDEGRLLRILVTGAAGLLGNAIVRTAGERGHDVRAFARSALDVTDPGEVERCLRAERPEVVVHCAAYTAGGSSRGRSRIKP